MSKWSDKRLQEIISKIPCDVTCKDGKSAQTLRSALYKKLGSKRRGYRFSVRGAILHIIAVEDPVVKIREVRR